MAAGCVSLSAHIPDDLTDRSAGSGPGLSRVHRLGGSDADADAPAGSGARAASTAPRTQQARSSSPLNGLRDLSRAQYPRRPAMLRLKWRQLEQEIDERWQTQQTAVSVCAAPQCGQRQLAMARF
jgi:hypothetical protein